MLEHAGVLFGLMTYCDLRSPELGRLLADVGAQVLWVCSSLLPVSKTSGAGLNAARAIENRL